jgi:hypothetical protein
MRTPKVCTESTSHGRTVSLNPKALGATTSSRRIRREENHFIFAVETKHRQCARNLQDSKMFTLLLQVLDLTLFNLFYPFSGTILERSESPAHSAYKPIVEPRRRYPVVKVVIVPKSEWAAVTLINLIYSLTKGSNFPIKNHLIINYKSSWNAHERPVYRRLSGIIGFEISVRFSRAKPFSSPGGEDQGEGELELVPCSTEPNIPIKNHLIINHKCSWSAHERPVNRRLSGIIGFEISFRLNRAKPFSSPRGIGYSAGAARTEGGLFPCATEPNIPIKIIVAVCKDPSVLLTVHRSRDFLSFYKIFDFPFKNFSRVGAAVRRLTSISSPGGEDKDEGGLSPRQSLIQIHNLLELSPQSSVLFIDYRPLSALDFPVAGQARLNERRPNSCTKFTISHKITQRDLHLNPLYTNHLTLNTSSPPHSPMYKNQRRSNHPSI